MRAERQRHGLSAGARVSLFITDMLAAPIGHANGVTTVTTPLQ
jgi:hypothetical protein